MNQTTKTQKISAILMAICFSVSANAAGDKAEKSGSAQGVKKEAQTATKGKTTTTGASTEAVTPILLEDVETLNDNLSLYRDKRITVTGEIENRPDARSMVIESGGIFDDEILVVSGTNIKAQDMQKFRDDMDVRVTGTLRAASFVDIKREYDWDLDPQVEIEFDGVSYFIVADSIVALESED